MAKFEKGKSGNPGGRPKKLADLVEACRDHTAESIAMLVKIMRDGRSPRNQLNAIKELLNRGWGQAVASTDLVVRNEADDPYSNIVTDADRVKALHGFLRRTAREPHLGRDLELKAGNSEDPILHS